MSTAAAAEPVLHGGCLCGAVRYRITGTVGVPEHCHCSMCRKAHGAAFSTNAVVASSALALLQGAAQLGEYESSPNRRKCFCSRCGSQLFIRRLNRPELTVIALGSLDDDPRVRPERHVFAAFKAPWYTIADGLPQFEVYPGLEPAAGEGDA